MLADGRFTSSQTTTSHESMKEILVNQWGADPDRVQFVADSLAERRSRFHSALTAARQVDIFEFTGTWGVERNAIQTAVDTFTVSLNGQETQMPSSKRVLMRAFALLLLALVVRGPDSAHASTASGDSIHTCVVFDYEQWRREHPLPAAKRPADLNVGEPRTVRMIYFLPNDWPYRADVVDSIKTVIKQSQTFYREQMKAHGYGDRTFAFESDAQGEPLVHRVDGRHPFSHYDNTLGNAVVAELERTFDLDSNVYFIVLGTDKLREGTGRSVGGVAEWRTKNGGYALTSDRFRLFVVSHELGHAFGLHHDFRDNRYIMSYGGRQRSTLSSCAAEYLAVHAYFNADNPTLEGEPPSVELTSSNRYRTGATRIPVQLQVTDPDGVHQVALIVRGFANREVVACRSVSGSKEAVIEFDYDGAIPSDGATVLSDSQVHIIYVDAIDKRGNVRFESYGLAEISASLIATWKGHRAWVESVSFSADGSVLASSSWTDETVKLWDVAKRQHNATFEGRTMFTFIPNGATLVVGGGDDWIDIWDVAAERKVATLQGIDAGFKIAISPDGTILANAEFDNMVGLWDVATRRRITILKGHTALVPTMSFAPDGTMLASGSHDNTVRLWDVATGRNIATFEVQDFGVWSVAFSPDGTTLAVGTFKAVELWDVASRERVAAIKQKGGVNSVTYSADGFVIASAASDYTVKLWDAATRRNIATFPNTALVNSVSFSSDRKTLASGAHDGTIALWDVSEWTRPLPDFNGDGMVGFSDFVQFAGKFGLSQGDAAFDARFDLDDDGTVGFGDFVIFAGRFGQSASPAG